MSFSNLPTEIKQKIFNYLDLSHYARVEQVSQDFQKLAQLFCSDLKYSKKQLDKSITESNAFLLWNYPEANYDINKDGLLSVIPSWNLIGRLFKWIRNWNSSIDKQVQKIARLTLLEGYRLAITANMDTPRCLMKMIVVCNWQGGSTYPINYLACRLSQSIRFKNLGEEIYQLFKQKKFFGIDGAYGSKRGLAPCHVGKNKEFHKYDHVLLPIKWLSKHHSCLK